MQYAKLQAPSDGFLPLQVLGYGRHRILSSRGCPPRRAASCGSRGRSPSKGCPQKTRAFSPLSTNRRSVARIRWERRKRFASCSASSGRLMRIVKHLICIQKNGPLQRFCNEQGFASPSRGSLSRRPVPIPRAAGAPAFRIRLSAVPAQAGGIPPSRRERRRPGAPRRCRAAPCLS